jgi:hypothetical protein
MTSTWVSTRVDRISEVNMTGVFRFDDMKNEATQRGSQQPGGD